MRVIKLGGSLADSSLLKNWLDAVAFNSSDSTVIVPGGGAFAEQVRVAQKQWRFDDYTAHFMALLAMQQMACMFQGINQNLHIASSVQEIKSWLDRHKVVIWIPDIKQLDRADIPACWDITSDSLAAWLAKELSATELFLVKSAPVSPAMTIQQMAEEGIVDKGFSDFIKDTPVSVKVLNRHELNVFTPENLS